MTEIVRIESAEQLDEVFAASSGKPVWIFKHSLTCPISSRAWSRFENYVEGEEGGEGTLFTLIEVQNHRPLSRAVAERTGIPHESPQAILLKEGAPVWHANHWSIKEKSLGQAQGG